MIDHIISKNNKRVMLAFSLKNSKNRRENKCFLCEGEKNLKMALEKNLVIEVFTLKQLPYVPNEISQHIVNDIVIDKLSNQTSPEGVVFIAKISTFSTIKYNKVVYLDNINDPGNLGTIIRTALAFNYDAVILSSNSVSIYNDKVLASCKGAIFKIPVFVQDLPSLKEKGMTVVVTALKKESVSISDLNIKPPFVLVFGNESHGVSAETLSLADIISYIPMNDIDSLNVGVCAGIYLERFK